MASFHSEIKIIVTDSPDESFTQLIETEIQSECVVNMNHETYQLLLSNLTTFEIEAAKGNLEVSGDTNLLRNFGKLLRNSN